MHVTAFIWQSSCEWNKFWLNKCQRPFLATAVTPPPPPCKKESGSIDLNIIWWSSLIFKQVSFFLHRCTFCIITLCVFEASLAPFWKKAGVLCWSPIAHPLAHWPYGFPQSSRSRQFERLVSVHYLALCMSKGPGFVPLFMQYLEKDGCLFLYPAQLLTWCGCLLGGVLVGTHVCLDLAFKEHGCF